MTGAQKKHGPTPPLLSRSAARGWSRIAVGPVRCWTGPLLDGAALHQLRHSLL